MISALYSLGVNIIKWPTTEEKQIVKDTIESHSKIPSCIGIMDGVLIPLTIKPSVQGEDYFTCKISYALSTLVVIDHEGKSLCIHASYASSTHDNQVFTKFKLWLDLDIFFEGEEVIMDNFAYTVSQNSILAYKPPKSNSRDNTLFN